VPARNVIAATLLYENYLDRMFVIDNAAGWVHVSMAPSARGGFNWTVA